MSEWVEKPWGKFRVRHSAPLLHVVEAHAGAGGSCSVHYHRKKKNIFFLSKGKMQVETLQVTRTPHGKESTFNVHILVPGKFFCVEAMVPHRFTALEDCDFVEIDSPSQPVGIWELSVTQEDIVRFESFEEALKHC